MSELLVLALIGLGTFAFRAAFLLTPQARQPAALERTLPYVAPAVLAAITVPMLLSPRGDIELAETLPALLSAGVAWLLWRRSRGLFLPLLAGLTTWWLLLAVVPA